MYYNDHEPPHFHVRYGEQRALIRIDNLTIYEGRLSPRVLGLVVEWATANRYALQEDWALARRQMPLKAVPPLE